MPIVRSDHGIWTLEPTDSELRDSHPVVLSYLPRYLNCLDPAFAGARKRSEFQFVLSLLRIRGIQDAGWDPWQTTVESIPSLLEAQSRLASADSVAAKHLSLWIYAHVLEASEPYEILMNLLDISAGGTFRTLRFPPIKRRKRSKGVPAPISPGEKIEVIEQTAIRVGLPRTSEPLRECWDRELRNATFHSDYSWHRGDLRLGSPTRCVSAFELSEVLNRTIAYYQAITNLVQTHLSSYAEPVTIPGDRFGDPDFRAALIVRENEGLTGFKDAWTAQELKAGRIPILFGRFWPKEVEFLRSHPSSTMIPVGLKQ